MNKLYDVLVSILIDATSEDDAKKKVRKFLADGMPSNLTYNFMVHKAETTDDNETLDDLRNSQEIG